ncbi:EAL domain-containing protein [Rhodoblastus acidophilus]|uniref:EAL domain-containing protein n=1 Tax=Candidatus Rhodoblastus alkanivorans TaxID=2954117 RepID=A0ABS9Z5T9_9HYPH|nr:EAL domain-containing protein [Candidatus Rhodoblastus alkanivorans]MCI4678624.1 EAL domain-containing protein [Candidatus Rhodoblastus alkanivorans]MCI4683034.1 EAL domain-containing protein [Candidatus Rhodoblastus alkanivorans]MDI4640344.1 EAL domain-containing protein [Rhodoblastus acidophilus]
MGNDFGALASAAAWTLMATAAVKIALQILQNRSGDEPGTGRLAQGFAGIAMAAALGFVTLASYLADAPPTFRTAAVICTFGYVVLTAERDGAPPHFVGLQAVGAFGLFAAGLAIKWDLHAPIALAAALSVGFSLFMATRRRARHNAKALEAQRRFSAALNGMSQCVGMFDSSGRLIAGNSEFLRMFRLAGHNARGMEAEELLTKKLGVRPKAAQSVKALCEAAQAVAKRHTRHVESVDLTDDRCMEFTFQPAPQGFSLLIEDCTARRASELRIERMARLDDLTGLSNRTRFREELESATAVVGEGTPPFAVMLIDLDRFKHVNDSLGHPVGDKLLQRVAKRLQEMAEEGDVVARLGGDEFVFLRPCLREEAAQFAAHAVETLSEPYHVDSAKLIIGASIGIAMAPDSGSNASELMKSADMALYAAKDAGRGAFRFFDKSMAEDALRKQEIERDLRVGIGRNELEVFYQPIVSLGRRRISACEALVRWRHPALGMVSPGEFMEIAEDSGIVVQLGEWVLRQACIDAKAWPRDVRLAVNFSAIQFTRGNLVEMVRRVLKETKFPAARLELEITESVLMHDADSVLTTIDELRGMGLRVALDDFGTGYSSLAYLSRFRPDKVKIDQSFVRDMDKNGTSLAIIKAVKAIVAELGIDMLVEGVETMEQFEILRANGADEAQGYLFSKPRPAQEIARLVSDPAQLVRGRNLMTEESPPWAKSFERVNPSVAQSLN